MNAPAGQAGCDALTVSNPDAGFVTGSQGAVATAAHQVTPWERHRHALTTANATQMVEQHRRQGVTEGAGFQTLDEHGHRRPWRLAVDDRCGLAGVGPCSFDPRAVRMALKCPRRRLHR